MNKMDSEFYKACNEITQNLLTFSKPSKTSKRRNQKNLCKIFVERIPRNHEILSVAKDSEFEQLRKVLLKNLQKLHQVLQ